MSQDLHLDRSDAGPFLAIVVSGTLNEALTPEELANMGDGRPVRIDLSNVSRITSFGVRQWVRGIQGLRDRSDGLVLERCSYACVSQLNLIVGFSGDALVASVMAPLLCDACGHEWLVQVDVSAGPPATMEQPCVKCGKPADLDEDPETYFAFTRAHSMVGDAKRQSLHAMLIASDGAVARAKASEAAAAEQAQREAEAKARDEAAAQAQRDAEARAREAEAAQARAEAEAREEAARAQRDADVRARDEAAAQAQRHADVRARDEAAAQAQRDADVRARDEAAAQAQRDADVRARDEAAAQARRDAEAKARDEAAAKAREEAATKAREEAAAKARDEAAARTRRDADAAALIKRQLAATAQARQGARVAKVLDEADKLLGTPAAIADAKPQPSPPAAGAAWSTIPADATRLYDVSALKALESMNEVSAPSQPAAADTRPQLPAASTAPPPVPWPDDALLAGNEAHDASDLVDYAEVSAADVTEEDAEAFEPMASIDAFDADPLSAEAQVAKPKVPGWGSRHRATIVAFAVGLILGTAIGYLL